MKGVWEAWEDSHYADLCSSLHPLTPKAYLNPCIVDTALIFYNDQRPRPTKPVIPAPHGPDWLWSCLHPEIFFYHCAVSYAPMLFKTDTWVGGGYPSEESSEKHPRNLRSTVPIRPVPHYGTAQTPILPQIPILRLISTLCSSMEQEWEFEYWLESGKSSLYFGK